MKKLLMLLCIAALLLSACGTAPSREPPTPVPEQSAPARETEAAPSRESPTPSPTPVPRRALRQGLELPENSRVAFWDFDGDGVQELCCQYEEGGAVVTEVWQMRDSGPVCALRESFPLSDAKDGGLVLLDWREETVPAWWYAVQEGARTRLEYRMLTPDFDTLRILRAELEEGEPVRYTVEDSVFEPDSYRRLMEGARMLLRYQSGDDGDEGVSLREFLGG